MQTFLFFALWVFAGTVKGQSAPIKTQKRVLAAVGGEADLSCQLTTNKDVHQVTWSKMSEYKDEDVCSYDKFMGETVNPDFKDKVEFKEAGLQINSIKIRNVTEEDEGCYFCSFIFHVDSSSTGRRTAGSCLQVYELHQPVLHVRESKSPGESLVSCSATGRPAPTVTLTVTQQHLSFSQHNTTTVHNNNNTVTVTTTAVLSGLHDDSTQVGCAVRVLSGPQMEVIQRIAELQQASCNVINVLLPITFLFMMTVALWKLHVLMQSRNRPRLFPREGFKSLLGNMKGKIELQRSPDPPASAQRQTITQGDGGGDEEVKGKEARQKRVAKQAGGGEEGEVGREALRGGKEEEAIQD